MEAKIAHLEIIQSVTMPMAINTLKRRHGWVCLSRCDLEAVRASLLEGMIAYSQLKLRRLAICG